MFDSHGSFNNGLSFNTSQPPKAPSTISPHSSISRKGDSYQLSESDLAKLKRRFERKPSRNLTVPTPHCASFFCSLPIPEHFSLTSSDSHNTSPNNNQYCVGNPPLRKQDAMLANVSYTTQYSPNKLTHRRKTDPYSHVSSTTGSIPAQVSLPPIHNETPRYYLANDDDYLCVYDPVKKLKSLWKRIHSENFFCVEGYYSNIPDPNRGEYKKWIPDSNISTYLASAQSIKHEQRENRFLRRQPK